MKLILLLPLTIVAFIVLLLMHLSEAGATVLPAVWDGKCTPIHMSTSVHQNPEDAKTQTGYIPPDKTSNDSDISACMPQPILPAGVLK